VVSLLLLAVLVPSICLLWFMTRAIRSERIEAQQKLLEAYRGHLALAQERLERRIEQLSDDLEADLEKKDAAAVFELVVKSGVADAAICFDKDGVMLYPQPTRPPAPERSFPEWSEALRLEASDANAAAKAFAAVGNQSTNRTVTARARQAEIRCLLEAGDKEKALQLTDSFFKESGFDHERDRQNRLIVADLELMAIQMLAEKNPGSEHPSAGTPEEAPGSADVSPAHPGDNTNGASLATSRGAAFANLARRARVQHRLETRLKDYSQDTMPASQRRFLMRELEALFPGDMKFPTHVAEDLAAQIIQAALPRPGEQMTLHPGPVLGVSQQGMAHGRVLLLHRSESLPPRIASWIPSQALPADVRIQLIPPGASPGRRPCERQAFRRAQGNRPEPFRHTVEAQIGETT